MALVGVCIVWNLEPLASSCQSSHKLIPHIICQFLCAREKTLNEDLFYKGSGASLPHLHTCENKVPFWDKSKFFASHYYLNFFRPDLFILYQMNYFLYIILCLQHFSFVSSYLFWGVFNVELAVSTSHYEVAYKCEIIFSENSLFNIKWISS